MSTLLNATQLSNLQTKYWNLAYDQHYTPVIAAGGTSRAAERACIAYLGTIGCTIKKIGQYAAVEWNNEKLMSSVTA